jgi:hypothetical protein
VQCQTGESTREVSRYISVRIAYDWKSDHRSERKDAEEFGNDGFNETWRFLKSEVEKVAGSVGKILSKRPAPAVPFRISIGRLRARHGDTVLGSILKRIRSADILIFDISTGNSNVLFELGCAISNERFSEKVFTLMDKSHGKPPSDLAGLMLTCYTRKNSNKPKLTDARGFQAAMRSVIISAAMEKEMWSEVTIEGEDNDR